MPHRDEYYVAISSDYDGDIIYFSPEGGICVEENWDKVIQIHVDVLEGIDKVDLTSKLPSALGTGSRRGIVHQGPLPVLCDVGFAYLEINPFTFDDGSIVPLDLVAKLDDAEEYWQTRSGMD